MKVFNVQNDPLHNAITRLFLEDGTVVQVYSHQLLQLDDSSYIAAEHIEPGMVIHPSVAGRIQKDARRNQEAAA